jgi:hypothetical protein
MGGQTQHQHREALSAKLALQDSGIAVLFFGSKNHKPNGESQIWKTGASEQMPRRTSLI